MRYRSESDNYRLGVCRERLLPTPSDRASDVKLLVNNTPIHEYKLDGYKGGTIR